MELRNRRIGLLGGGPAALFMMKRLLESGYPGLSVTIFEKTNRLGAGMPYSECGAGKEHITNVSDNEIPEINTHIKDWLHTAPEHILEQYRIDANNFNEYKVLPRLLFGRYLEDQFNILIDNMRNAGAKVTVLFGTRVTDVKDFPGKGEIKVYTEKGESYIFSEVVMCTGHNWPVKFEGTVKGWYDSPYPPQKLEQQVNFPVAIKGSSLTAIDAVRTLARNNGSFTKNEDYTYSYKLNEGSENFKLVMHSLGGFLPAIRFHLADTQLTPAAPLEGDEVYKAKEAFGGFIPLDFMYERNFLQPLMKHRPEFYETIKEKSIEEFVEYMMSLRERVDAFNLFEGEYLEAEKSIERQQSVLWKEELATLSYALNYPAKHLSAEDMLRLKKVLMPLISIVIAFVPQGSVRELLALHKAGVLSLVDVDAKSNVVPGHEEGATYTYTNQEGEKIERKYKIFIDAVGQPPILYNDFPFASLRNDGTISSAHLRFRDNNEGLKEKENGNANIIEDSQGNYYLQVPGISINDHFQVLDRFGSFNPRVYIMAVPYIGGLNPDYSGLDFCEAASVRIADAMFEANKV